MQPKSGNFRILLCLTLIFGWCGGFIDKVHATSQSAVTSDTEINQMVDEILPDDSKPLWFSNSYGYRLDSRIRYIPVSVNADGGYSSAKQDYIQKLNVMVPFLRTYSSIMFLNGDASIGFADGGLVEWNIGAIYRYLGNRAIYGIYGYYNRQDVNAYNDTYSALEGNIYVDSEKNQNSSAIAGIEILTRHFELRSNYYMSLTDTEGFNPVDGNYIVLPDSNELLLRYGGCSGSNVCKLAYDGFDVELGLTFFDAFQLYFSYYYFENDKLKQYDDDVNFILINDDNSITYLAKPTFFQGYKIRSDIALWQTGLMDVQLQLSYSDDDLRGEDYYAGLKFGFTFGRRQKNPDDIINDMRNAYDYLHMSRNDLQIKIAQPTVHNNNIISLLSINNPNFTTGLADDMNSSRRIYFVDLSLSGVAGKGTWEDKTSLEDALNRAKAEDVVFITSKELADGSFTNQDSSIIVDKNIQLQGNQGSFLIDGYTVDYAGATFASEVMQAHSRFDTNLTNQALITFGTGVSEIDINGINFYNHAKGDDYAGGTARVDNNAFIDTSNSMLLRKVLMRNNGFYRLELADGASGFTDLKFGIKTVENASYSMVLRENTFAAGTNSTAEGGFTDIIYENYGTNINSFVIEAMGETLKIAIRGVDQNIAGSITQSDLAIDTFSFGNTSTIHTFMVDNLKIHGVDNPNPDGTGTTPVIVDPLREWKFALINNFVINDSVLTNVAVNLKDVDHVKMTDSTMTLDNGIQVDTDAIRALFHIEYTAGFTGKQISHEFTGGNTLTFINSTGNQGVGLVDVNILSGLSIDSYTLNLGNAGAANEFDVKWYDNTIRVTDNVDLFRLRTASNIGTIKHNMRNLDSAKFGVYDDALNLVNGNIDSIISMFNVITTNTVTIGTLNLDNAYLVSMGASADLVGNIDKNIKYAVRIGKNDTVIPAMSSFIYTNNTNGFSMNDSTVHGKLDDTAIYLNDVNSIILSQNNIIKGTLSNATAASTTYNALYFSNNTHNTFTLDLGTQNTFNVENSATNAAINIIGGSITQALTDFTITSGSEISDDAGENQWTVGKTVTGKVIAGVNITATQTIQNMTLKSLALTNITNNPGDVVAFDNNFTNAIVVKQNATDADILKSWNYLQTTAGTGGKIILRDNKIYNDNQHSLTIESNISNVDFGENNTIVNKLTTVQDDGYAAIVINTTAIDNVLNINLGKNNNFTLQENAFNDNRTTGMMAITATNTALTAINISSTGEDAKEEPNPDDPDNPTVILATHNDFELQGGRTKNSTAIKVSSNSTQATVAIDKLNFVAENGVNDANANMIQFNQALSVVTGGGTAGNAFVDIVNANRGVSVSNTTLNSNINTASHAVLHITTNSLTNLANNDFTANLASGVTGDFQVVDVLLVGQTGNVTTNLGHDNNFRIRRQDANTNAVVNGIELALQDTIADDKLSATGLTIVAGKNNLFFMEGGGNGLDSAMMVVLPTINSIKNLTINKLTISQDALTNADGTINDAAIEAGSTVDSNFGRGLTIASKQYKNDLEFANSLLAIENNLIHNNGTGTDTITISNSTFTSTSAGRRGLTLHSKRASTSTAILDLILQNNIFNVLTADNSLDAYSLIDITNDTTKTTSVKITLANNDFTIGTGTAGTGAFNNNINFIALGLSGDAKLNLELTGTSEYTLNSTLAAGMDASAILVDDVNGAKTKGEDLIETLNIHDLVLANASYTDPYFLQGNQHLNITQNMSANITRGIILGQRGDDNYFIDAHANNTVILKNNTFAGSNRDLVDVSGQLKKITITDNKFYADTNLTNTDTLGYQLLNIRMRNSGSTDSTTLNLDNSWIGNNIYAISSAVGALTSNIIFENISVENVGTLNITGNRSNTYIYRNNNFTPTSGAYSVVATNLDIKNAGDTRFKVNFSDANFDNSYIRSNNYKRTNTHNILDNIERGLIVNGALNGAGDQFTNNSLVEINDAASMNISNVVLRTANRRVMDAAIGLSDENATPLKFSGTNEFYSVLNDNSAIDATGEFLLTNFIIGSSDSLASQLTIEFGGNNRFTLINNTADNLITSSMLYFNLSNISDRPVPGDATAINIWETLELKGTSSNSLMFSLVDNNLTPDLERQRWSTAIDIITNANATMPALKLSSIYLVQSSDSTHMPATATVNGIDRGLAFNDTTNPMLDVNGDISKSFVYVNNASGLEIDRSTLMANNRSVVEYRPNLKNTGTANTQDLLSNFIINNSTIYAYLSNQSVGSKYHERLEYFSLIKIVDLNSTATSLNLTLGNDVTANADGTYPSNNRFIIENTITNYKHDFAFISVQGPNNLAGVTLYNSMGGTSVANVFKTIGMKRCSNLTDSGKVCADGDGQMISVIYDDNVADITPPTIPTIDNSGAVKNAIIQEGAAGVGVDNFDTLGKVIPLSHIPPNVPKPPTPPTP